MIEKIIKAIFGDIDVKKVKRYKKEVALIRALEKKYDVLTLDDIQRRNREIKDSFTGIDFATPEGTKALKE